MTCDMFSSPDDLKEFSLVLIKLILPVQWLAVHESCGLQVGFKSIDPMRELLQQWTPRLNR